MRVIIKKGVVYVNLDGVLHQTKYKAKSLSDPVVKGLYKNFTPELPDDGTLGAYFRTYTASMDRRLSKSGRPFSVNTIRIYSSLSSLINNYETPLFLNQYDLNTVKSKRDAVHYWDEWFEGFISHQKALGHANKTIGERMNLISIVVKHYEEKEFVRMPKVPRVSFEEKPIRTLHPDFVKKFLTDRRYFGPLNPVWELCATILVTSLRLGDAMNLTESDFTDDFRFMRRMNQKTKAYSMVPIPDFLADSYRKNKIYSGTFDDVYKRIRELFSMYEEMNVLADGKPMYETIHPHMLRKSAITTMLAMGVDREHVKFASGHSQRSAAFEKYVGFVESVYQNQIGDYYKKIGI